MSTYSAEKFLNRLSELKGSAHSIQTLSYWMLQYKQHDVEIVQLWLNEIERERCPNRLVDLFHLANDVVQSARRRHPAYLHLIGKKMCRAVQAATKVMHQEQLQKLQRMLVVWKTRCVYDGKFIDALVQIVRSSRMDTNGVAAIAPPVLQDDDEDLMPSYGFSRTSSESSWHIPKDDNEIRNVLSAAPSTDDMLRMLDMLDNSPSANASIRNSIASFPAHLMEFTNVINITDAQQLADALNSIYSMDKLVSEYNDKLAEEIASRLEIGRRLDAFVDEARRVIAFEVQRHAQMRRNLVKMAKDRENLADHLNSLPSTAPFMENADQQRMPTVAELFKR